MTAAGHLRRIVAVAGLAFREAVRSRAALSSALATAAAIFAIRRATGGAGEEAAHNFTFYALAAAEAILYTSALLASAASISGEAKSRTLSLSRVKPVPMAEFLAGRWLGLTAVFALILALALALVRVLAPAGAGGVAYRRVAPSLPPVAEMAERLVAEARGNGVADEVALRKIRREALAQLPFATVPIPPGDALHFRFAPTRPIDGAREMLLEVAFCSDSYSSRPLSAACVISAPGEDAAVRLVVSNVTSRLVTLPFDPAPFAGATELKLDVAHGGAEGDMPVLLQPRQSLALLAPAFDVSANYAVAFAQLLPVVALLLALGLALGSLFSLPVSTFCAAGLALSVFAAGFSSSDPDSLELDEDAPLTALQRATGVASVAVVKSLDFAAASVMRPAPAALLSDRIAIPGGDVAHSIACNGVLMPLALLLAAGAILDRREMP